MRSIINIFLPIIAIINLMCSCEKQIDPSEMPHDNRLVGFWVMLNYSDHGRADTTIEEYTSNSWHYEYVYSKQKGIYEKTSTEQWYTIDSIHGKTSWKELGGKRNYSDFYYKLSSKFDTLYDADTNSFLNAYMYVRYKGTLKMN